MLKQLELIGFKSFAERTVFEFGPGITAVVGPNGSGKSNVVDAVRWIMGEQSAKSLRGGGMTDVIFNGSSTRKSFGLAEVTLTLDNSKRFLSIDSDDVQITRRVYRDGTGEYLINRQITRLKDIKELFLGSGAGVDAYCIIAQGKVEALLQASSQERRLILEEAAGISRFRVKKLETLKKLEQVELNLQRIRDIRDELNKQLQSVRLQAAKAEKFQDYNRELKRLRVELALQEWHQDTQKWQSINVILAELKQSLDSHSSQTSEQERLLSALESELAKCEELSHQTEAVLSELRERLAKDESTIQHELSTGASLANALTQLTARKQQLNQQESRLHALHQELESRFELERKDADQAKQNLDGCEQHLQVTVAELATLRNRVQQDKEILFDRLQTAARSHNNQVSLKSQADSLRLHRRRLGEKHNLTQGHLSALDRELQSLQVNEKDILEKLDCLQNNLASIRDNREKTSLELESKSAQWTSVRERRSGVDSRILVLDHLERSREGLGSGVRKILELAGQENPGPWSTVIGLVADLIMVDRDHANFVDTALGDQVQALVIRDESLLREALQSLGEQFPGRITYLPIAAFNPTRSGACIPGLESLATFVGTTHPDVNGLVNHLLAHIWLVDSLEQARHWALHYPGQSWITRNGDLLTDQSFVSMGPDHQEHGFLSRKSELRELRSQLTELDDAVLECEQEINSLRSMLARHTSQEEQAEQEIQVQSGELASVRSRLQQKQLQGQDLAEEFRISQHEIHSLDEELARLTHDEAIALERASEAEQAAQLLQMKIQQDELRISELDYLRQKDQEAITNASVAFARAEQGLEALTQRLEAVRQDHADKLAGLIDLDQQIADVMSKQDQSRLLLEQAQQAVDQGRLKKDQLDAELAALKMSSLQLRQDVSQLREQNIHIRQEWQQLNDKIHKCELEAGEIRLKLDGLAIRLAEEHDVSLADEYSRYQPLEQLLDITSTQNEILELRRKISRLGNVSLDSLVELSTLESRAQDLQTQLEDLQQSKSALDEIIHRINADSKKLFKETFEAVRAHFQDLFRKLFGGGMADIVLENPDDLLETGVDIVGKPPGKEMRNMSLLSGGEKTLTAVALLLAIFKNKPSPFCIMDEVDAALDEANVGRFAAVLREFLHLSQFILITHSKKTMASADVLYGVTMQEAGVSKRVAVKLDEYEEPAQRLAA